MAINTKKEVLYVSFGSSHLKKYNVNPLNIQVKIEGNSLHSIHNKIEKWFGDNYCITRTEEYAKAAEIRYNMRIISLQQLQSVKFPNTLPRSE